MYNFLLKKGQMVAFLVGAAIAVVHIVLSMTTTETFKYVDASGADVTKDIAGVSTGLMISYVLIGVAVLAFLVGVAKYFIENPRQIKSLLGFFVLFALVGVFVIIASGDAPAVLQPTLDKEGITPGIYKYVSGSVNATLILLALAFVGLIVSEVTSLLK